MNTTATTTTTTAGGAELNEFGYRSDLAAESWVARLARIHAAQSSTGLTPARTVIVESLA